MNDPGEVHCMVSTGNEINKGQRNPTLRSNRDTDMVAFTVLLEIDLVVAEG